MSINSSNYSKRTYKIVLLGDSGVGKTCIIERFISNKYDPKDIATVGIDFVGKNVHHNSKTYRLQLWDTAGQQRYRSLIPSYLKDAQCAIFVYDVSNDQSLQNMEQWVKLFKQSKGQKNLMIFCGNKSDLDEKYDVKTLTYLLSKYSSQEFKVSALTGENVDYMFKQIIEILAQEQNKKKKKKLEESGILLPTMSCQNLTDKFTSELDMTEKNEVELKSMKTEGVTLDEINIKEQKKKCYC